MDSAVATNSRETSTTKTDEPVIVFEGVSLAFDDKVILDGISFTLLPGRLKVILGASGSGKSTILRLILGLLKPDAGKIYSVTIPAGACISRSAGSCVYKNSEARKAKNGLAYFRVLYQAGTHGNKMWLQSYGDLSSATDPVMSFLVYMDDILYASLDNEVFTPTHNGWVGF